MALNDFSQGACDVSPAEIKVMNFVGRQAGLVGPEGFTQQPAGGRGGPATAPSAGGPGVTPV
jgi:hypothetical protein